MRHGAKLRPELIHSTILTSFGPFASAVGTSDKEREKGSNLFMGQGTYSRVL